MESSSPSKDDGRRGIVNDVSNTALPSAKNKRLYLLLATTVVLSLLGNFFLLNRHVGGYFSVSSPPPSTEMNVARAGFGSPDIGTSTSTSSIPKHCLSLDFDGGGDHNNIHHSLATSGSMDAILSPSEKGVNKQVYILMPAKGAGTSLKRFTAKCTNFTTRDNFLNYPVLRKDMLVQSLELPKIVTSHILRDGPLAHLAKHATSESVIVLIYRDETDRLLSGIREVASHRLCRGIDIPPGFENITLPSGVKRDRMTKSECILDESLFVGYIEQRRMEVGLGIPEILTCQTYAALEEENHPNFFVMNYREVDRLQRLLAKHHCPHLLDKPLLRANLGNDQIPVSIRLQNAKQPRQKAATVVKLDDWLASKGELIEFSLGLKSKMTCQGKTRKLAHALSQCPDGMMKGWGGGSAGDEE